MNHLRCLLFAVGLLGVGVWATPQAPEPVTMNAEQAHRHMLDQLGIDSLRPGANGWDPDAPNQANTDEAKASPYETLPDALVMNDGTPVTTVAQWWDERRPEIIELFDREIYGRVPEDVPGVAWSVVEETQEDFAGVTAVKKTLRGTVDNSAYPAIEVAIEARLVLPADAEGAVPVIVEFGWDPQSFRRRNQNNEGEDAGPPPPPAWQVMLLEKGWGFAVIYPSRFQADNGDGLTRGIIGLANHGQPRGPEDWGALRAWAWGASRLVDYLETEGGVDASRLGITGLSRYGKAAAVAMAYEDRFAVGFIGSSGQGGTKIMRRDFGERVENIAGGGQHHWVAGNYLKYAGPLTPNDLPIDAHMLVALCAPRPVFVSVGSLNVEGTWIDAKGNFLAAAHADPVYELLGKRGLGTMEMPGEKEGLLEGDVAFRMHDGGHTTGPNWPAFIAFASRYFDGDASDASPPVSGGE